MIIPPLPKAERIEAVQFCDDAYWFSAEQMREYGRLVRAQALEEAAGVCDTLGVHPALNVYNGGPDWYKHGKQCAAAIRALKEKT